VRIEIGEDRGQPADRDSGWLNRALQAMGPGKAKAISVSATSNNPGPG
jgi:hypothetical protein